MSIRSGISGMLRGVLRMRQIEFVQLEVSFTDLYEGAPKYHDVMRHMDEQGFDLAGISPSFFEQRTFQFLQADAIFSRRGAVHSPRIS